ncbi:MAG: hypothetical protein FWG31_07480 [Oscillospiraceae bacterium]|nr:hypothetical protein [Oscillospiraceae bacterium]
MDRSNSALIKFAAQTMVNFAVCIMMVSAVGWAVGDSARETGGFMRLGSDGLAYASIGQIFLFSLTVTGVNGVFFFVSKRLMLLWRYTMIGGITFIITVAFSLIFQWFPTGNGLAWISFLISFGVSMTGGILFMILKTKLEDKKYGKQLSDYKARQSRERREHNDSHERDC